MEEAITNVENPKCNQLVDHECGFVPCQKCGVTHSKCPLCGIAVDLSRPLQSYEDWECGTKKFDGAITQSILCRAICAEKDFWEKKIQKECRFRRGLVDVYSAMSFDFVDKDERWKKIGIAINGIA